MRQQPEMTTMFGPSLCSLCGHVHASGFDCVAAKARQEEQFRKLAAKTVRRIPSTPTREPIYPRIGAWIQRQRKHERFRQEDLAGVIGLTRTSVVNIEAGRQRIYLDQFVLIVQALDPADATGILAALARIVRTA